MNTKILIVGIGGVGGYYGGLLAKFYQNSNDVSIHFLARGKHLECIQNNGLIIETDDSTLQVHPHTATDNASTIAEVDYVILASKSYDIESTIHQIKPCLKSSTIILPLLNGIDNSEKIRKLLPNTEVWEGCCYIVSKITEPGKILKVGNIHRLVYGSLDPTDIRLKELEKIFLEAGIQAELFPNIRYEIWKKFFFISTSASLTSYFDVSYKEVLTDPIRKQTLIDASTELIQIANAEGIQINESEIDRLIHQFDRLPNNTTTSMHRDFQAKNKTELETLTGIVVKLAKRHNIDCPCYQKIYSFLLEKQAK